MLKRLILLFTISFVLLFTACSPKHSEIIVAEYGNHDITMNEFEKAYVKNVGSLEEAKRDSLHQYENFLDLYVNFKMKLQNAKVRDLPNDTAILKEIDEYERTIGSSYLLEKEVYEKGIKELYDRRSEEIRVSHILIRTDTISDEKAKEKALAIIERIKNGSSFEDEVLEHSDDQFSKKNGGDIYYITAGMIMPEFEDIAYNTPIGEVNAAPLKTKYGYHIIKVTDRIKRVPKIKASHILIRHDDQGNESGKKPKELIQDILATAKEGHDFGDLAAEYSEDPGSKENKGDLGFFARRQMVQPFDEAAFKLEVGEISDIVETQFGYHIIKLTGKEDYPSFDDQKKVLREQYEKSRKNADYNNIIEKYSKEFNFVENSENITVIKNALGDSLLNGNYWNSEFYNNYGNYKLFELDEVEYTLDSLLYSFLNDPKMMGGSIVAGNFDKLFDEFKDKKVIERKASELINSDEEFASLMKEYKNGILIFRLQEDEVWENIQIDSAAIYELYEETKDNYVLNDRVKFLEIYSKSDSLINEYYSLLKQGRDFDSLMISVNKKSINSKNEFIDANSNELSRTAFSLKEEGEFSEIIKNSKGWSIVKLVEKDPSRIKTFEEAKAEVTSLYQDLESERLEKEYIAKLKEIYKPKLYYEELEKTYNN